MKIYFLRHGAAGDRETWGGPDSDRPLTEEGEQELRSLAKKFAKLGFTVEELRTSPYARALGTAKIVSKGLGLTSLLTIDERLAPGFDSTVLKGILAERPRCASLLLVGHEPDLSKTIGQLTGCSRVEMKKGGLARVDYDPGTGVGTLVWLLPPKVLLGRG